ncbi:MULTISPECIES: type II toxin-antitoxin system VapB family antitoxin [unclassified Endozoicomonas]|uniref:type II toxin-antitoxin system VapB family antitoxin n=1 Tax=unclassified Endozoicomonas TaxID=2644528 RepID=UPI002147A377|nr:MULTISPECIES: type II toxin-antitoxin system VapB family antitoxin [unclassified Endozoicomonas]
METSVFRNNRSQAVRIPKEFELPEGTKRVRISKRGESILITPIEGDWDSFFQMIDENAVEFEREPQPDMQIRDLGDWGE